MTENTGSVDRIVRILAGFALLAWAFWGTDPYHQIGWIGVILLATAAMGFCPLYRVLGISTCPVPQRKGR
jgi:hypothetical protein